MIANLEIVHRHVDASSDAGSNLSGIRHQPSAFEADSIETGLGYAGGNCRSNSIKMT